MQPHFYFFEWRRSLILKEPKPFVFFVTTHQKKRLTDIVFRKIV